MVRRKVNLTAMWLVCVLISALIAYSGYRIGQSQDCAPNQIDGQCGLATFVFLIYGLAVAFIVLIVATISVVVLAHRRRKRMELGSASLADLTTEDSQRS